VYAAAPSTQVTPSKAGWSSSWSVGNRRAF